MTASLSWDPSRNIFFYANRRSATGYIYVYPLVENQDLAQQMQREMISEVTKAKPKFVVFVDVVYSWLRHPNSPNDLIQWWESYRSRYYHVVGLIDVLPEPTTTGVWGPDAQVATPVGSNFLTIYQRN